MLGSSRAVVQSGQTSACYEADFYPFGGERPVTNTCGQDFKFEGKQRDSESGLDDFGARYYSSAWGRFASSDWSAVPVPVPYANLTNPQTLNLYAMVSDNPETFADLDGHIGAMPPPPPGSEFSSNAQIDAYFLMDDCQPPPPGDPQVATQEQRQQTAQPDTTQSGGQQQSPTQTKQLTAEDVTKAIQAARDDKGPHAKIAADFLNSLGKSWKLSGDALQQALKESSVNAHGVDKNVDSISRTGDKVTVQLKKGFNFLEIYKTKATVSFDVGEIKGRPALTNIEGVEVFHGYHYVPKTSYGPN